MKTTNAPTSAPSAASGRIAARADERRGFEAAVRAALAAICEELELIGARAVVEAQPEPCVWWHVGQPEAMRFLLQHVHPQSSGERCEGLEYATAVVAVTPSTRIEVFGAPHHHRVHELPVACQGLAAVLAGKRTEPAGAPASPFVEMERDALTGLASRFAFLQRLEAAFERARTAAGAAVAVLFLDMDRFRRVNNSIGTAAGDSLLAQVAARIGPALPQGAVASRLGADEFAVLLENVRDPGQALRIADRLHGELQQPVQLEAMEVFSTVSIGIAFSGQACASANELLRNADTAMARARIKGPGKTVLWDSSMAVPGAARLQMEMELRRALERTELYVGYQPILSLTRGEITGFEALARWNHPRLGEIPAGAFVQVAEDAGLIERLGLTIFREACQQMRSLELGRRVPLTLSVNLSARQIVQPSLVDEMAAVLAETGMDPTRLQAEVTESVLVENREAAASTLRRLRDMHVRVFLDDFGTGYSSLSYLHDLPVDGLKIDRCFIEALRSGERASKLVGSILGLAHSLELEVVAEGVETEAQATALSALHCGAAQGFLFARAVRAPQARALLQKPAFFWR